MINDDLVFLDVDITNKFTAIDFLTKKLVAEKYVEEDGKDFKKHILNREEDISTDMGNDIAIPHAKSKDIKVPFISYMRLKNPIIWNEQKDSKISMIFMLGVPDKSDNGVHLKMLSDLARKLIDNDFLKMLKNVNNPQKIVTLLGS